MKYSGLRHLFKCHHFLSSAKWLGRRCVGGTLLAGPNRPPHKARDTWKVKLAECGGFCAATSGKGLPPKSNISPPSMSQSCGGAEGTVNRGTRQCHPKYFVSTPSISSGSPRVRTVKVTLGPLKKMEHFSSQVGTTQRSTLTWIFLLD